VVLMLFVSLSLPPLVIAVVLDRLHGVFSTPSTIDASSTIDSSDGRVDRREAP
jgi:hypothetical protein